MPNSSQLGKNNGDLKQDDHSMALCNTVIYQAQVNPFNQPAGIRFEVGQLFGCYRNR
jgi:hypothetical protein